jgi:GNAT superfamily N-acetyltransferase
MDPEEAHGCVSGTGGARGPRPAPRIVRARPGDAGRLTSIAREAKAHLGYPGSWLRRWERELTLTPAQVRIRPTYAAVSGRRIIGFYSLSLAGREAALEHLWVIPSEIRRGAGRILFRHAERLARGRGAARMTIASDPHAEGFYAKMGAAPFGRVPASMDGVERFLPLLEKPL